MSKSIAPYMFRGKQDETDIHPDEVGFCVSTQRNMEADILHCDCVHKLGNVTDTFNLLANTICSIPTSDISNDGTCGRKSFPTNRHMKTKSSINLSRSNFTVGSGILRLSAK